MSARAISLELCKLSSRGAQQVTPCHRQMACVLSQTEGPLCTGPQRPAWGITEAPADPRAHLGGQATLHTRAGCSRSQTLANQRLKPDRVHRGSPLGGGVSRPASPMSTNGCAPQHGNRPAATKLCVTFHQCRPHVCTQAGETP